MIGGIEGSFQQNFCRDWAEAGAAMAIEPL